MMHESRGLLLPLAGLVTAAALLAGCPRTTPDDGTAAESATGAEPGAAATTPPPPSGPTTTPAAVATPPVPPDGGGNETAMGPQFEDPADRATRVAQAEQLIRDMVAAYRSAPAMIDRIDVETKMGGQAGPPSHFDIMLGPGADLSVVSEANEIVAADGHLYFALTRIKDKYIKLPLREDMLTTLTHEFGAYRGVMVQPALRYAKPWPELLYSLSLGLPGAVRPDNYRVVTGNDGRTWEQLTLISEAGTAVIFVDQETKLIARAELEYIPPESPLPNFRVNRTFTFSPVVYEELPTPVAFDTRGRHAVDSLSRLTGRLERDKPVELAIAVGETVPDFSLYTLEGEKRTLSDARGKVVVLTFWATNVVGARTGLPVLDRYAKTRARTPEVVFWPIVTSNPDWDTAFEFWQQQHIELECLIDREGDVAKLFDLPGLPVSVIVDAEGRLTTAVPRLDPGFTDDLEVGIMQAADAADL